MTPADRGRDYYAWRMIAIVSTVTATLWIVVAAVTDAMVQCFIAVVWVLIAAVAVQNVRKRSHL